MRRAAVTGIGAVSGFGNGCETLWQNLISGNSAVRTLEERGFPGSVGAPVSGGFDRWRKYFKTEMGPGKCAEAGLEAAAEALGCAGLSKNEAAGRCGAIIMNAGSVSEKSETVYGLLKELYERSGTEPLIDESPFDFGAFEEGFSGIDPSAATAAALGTSCIVESISNACASAAMAIGRAADLIRRGRIDLALCGGADMGCSLNELALFSVLNAQAKGNDPKTMCRPFAGDRSGCVIGEGAGVLVLEEMETAVKRGAVIYGEVRGSGAVTDIHHVTSPDMEAKSYAACIENALRDSGTDPGCVDYINAHGTGTYYNDMLETMAVQKVFGKAAQDIPISSIKAQTGHLLSAAGAIEAVVSIMAMACSMLPQTINLKTRDEMCSLDYISEGPRPKDVRTVLSNSFGFGGQNVTLVFGKAGT